MTCQVAWNWLGMGWVVHSSRRLPGNSQATPRIMGGSSPRLISRRWCAVATASPEARLLVVDAEPNIVELLSASLRFVGFEVTTATDGIEALQQARRNRPDLLVLDVMMPGLDGFDMVRKLRGEGLRMPVLFLTARDATADRVTGLTLGGDDY